MKKFEEGKWYYCRSLGDYDTIYVVQVICRTAKRITYEENGKVKRAMVRDDGDGAECFRPHGRYALAAVIRADRELCPLTPETAKIASLVLNIENPGWGTWGFPPALRRLCTTTPWPSMRGGPNEDFSSRRYSGTGSRKRKNGKRRKNGGNPKGYRRGL